MKTLHVILVERGRPVERRFTEFPIFVGRHPSNTLTLASATVSRFHAQIDVEGNDVVVRDEGTRLGTLVEDGMDIRRLCKASFRREREIEFTIEGTRIRATLSETQISELTPAFLGTTWRAANLLLSKAEQSPSADASKHQLVYAQGALDELRQAQSTLRGALRSDAMDRGESDASDGVATYLDATLALLRRIENCLSLVRERGLEADPDAPFVDTIVTRGRLSEEQSRPTLNEIEPAPSTPTGAEC